MTKSVVTDREYRTHYIEPLFANDSLRGNLNSFVYIIIKQAQKNLKRCL